MRDFGIRATAVLLLAVASYAAGPARDVNLFAIADGLKKNQQELQRYVWKLRLTVTLAGEEQSKETFEARLDAEGRLQPTPIDHGAGRTAKKRKKKTRMHRLELRALLMSYVNMTPEQMGEAMTHATVVDDADGAGSTTRVQARSAIREGDSLDLWVDTESRKPRRFEVFTSLRGEPVKLVARFAELDRGPAYPERATVETEIKEKKMIITIENFDFRRAEE